MADVEVSYENQVIKSLSASGQLVCHTAGKYCDDDITIDYTAPGGGGGQTLTITNIFPTNISLVKGYLASNAQSITAQGGTTKEVTTDYIDISSYTGQYFQFWLMCANGVMPWIAFAYYDSSYNLVGTRQGLLECFAGNLMSTYNIGMESEGVTKSVLGASKPYQFNTSLVKYIRMSFRTGGNAKLCVSTDTTKGAEYFSDKDYQYIAFSNPIESDGNAT